MIRQLTKERDSLRDGAPMTPRPSLSSEMVRTIDVDMLKLDPEDSTVTTAARVEALIERLAEEQEANAALRDENQQLRDKLDAHTTSHFASSRPTTTSIVVPRLLTHAQSQKLFSQGLIGVYDAKTAAAGRHQHQPAEGHPRDQQTRPMQPPLKSSAADQLPDTDVHPYLRQLGTVPRVDATKRDLCYTFSALWEFRRHDRVTTPDLHTSVYKFFTQRAAPKAAVARAVNFLDNVQRHRYMDSRFELFLGIMDGLYPERLMLDVLGFVDDVRKEVRLLAGSQRAARIRKGLFMDVIGRKLIDYKSQAAKEHLKTTLGRDPTLDVDELCSATHPFMEAIIVQGCDERIDLFTRIIDAFTQAAAPDGTLTYDDVNNCFFHVDPSTTQGTVIELCKPDPLAHLRASGGDGNAASAGSDINGSLAGAPSSSEDAAVILAPDGTPATPPEGATIALSLLIERLSEISIQREPAFE
jgi:regulator of replication initiation timing